MGSSIPTNQYDGDVSVGRNAAVGGNAKVSGNMRVGHNLTVDGWIEAKNIKGPDKGLFKSVEKLRATHPIPHDGWWALVGDSLPAPVYVADGGEWVATGEQGGTPSIDDTDTNERIEQLSDDMGTVKAELSSTKSSIAEKASSKDLSNLAETVDTKASSEDLDNLKKIVGGILEGAVYRGLAVPDFDPGTPEQKVLYLANGAGAYAKFGELVVTDTEIAFLFYDGEGWKKHAFDLSALDKKAGEAGDEAKKAFDKADDAASAASANADAITDIQKDVEDLSKKVDGLDIPRIVCMPQAAYDALPEKAPGTTYLTTEE